MEKSFPFNAVTVNGVPDRVYTAEDFARERAAYVTSGVTSPEGLAVTPGEGGGLTLTVAPGAACISGYTYWNDTPLSLALAAPDGAFPRCDRVILRLDLKNREIRAAVKTGIPAEVAAPPSLTETTELYELPLCRLTLWPGQTEIPADTLTDERVQADYVLNPKEVAAAIEEYKAALSAYFDGEDADTLADAAKILKKDKGGSTVLCGDGVYRPLPASGRPMTELCRFTESGTFYPADYPTEGGLYTLVLQGGGGGGGRGTAHRGGSSGGYAVLETLLPGDSYPVTVGKGGAARYGVSNSSNANGNDGAETVFGPFRVPGGAGGKNGSVTPATVGLYTCTVGTDGPSGQGGSSLFGEGGKNSSTGNAFPGGIGAGGGACSYSSGGSSGAGGDGIVIVYGGLL